MDQEQNSLLNTPETNRRFLYWLPAIFLSVGIVVLIVIIFYKSYENDKANLSRTKDILGAQSQKETQETRKIIKVDIEGAVVKPGLYEVLADARIQDILISAGGLSPKADREYVAKNVNLAARLNDGAKIYIPFAGETPTTNLSNSTNSTNPVGIDINTATMSQLESLSGVGPATAGKIISGRPYQNISELVSKKIIYKSVFEKIKDKISVN